MATTNLDGCVGNVAINAQVAAPRVCQRIRQIVNVLSMRKVCIERRDAMAGITLLHHGLAATIQLVVEARGCVRIAASVAVAGDRTPGALCAELLASRRILEAGVRETKRMLRRI